MHNLLGFSSPTWSLRCGMLVLAAATLLAPAGCQHQDLAQRQLVRRVTPAGLNLAELGGGDAHLSRKLILPESSLNSRDL